MKEEQIYLYSTPEGPINIIEGNKMPVRLDLNVRQETVYDAADADEKLKRYEALLQAAKASSVPIQDQEKAKRMIMQWLNDQPLGKGMIERDRVHGPLTVRYRIEDACAHDSCPVDATCEHCKEPVQVAILYDDTPATKGNLLPCPFCGSQPEWINEALADSHFYIRCPHCHIVMKEDRRDKVIGMWNSRHDTPEKDEDKAMAEIAKAHIRNAPTKVLKAAPEKEESQEEITRPDFRKYAKKYALTLVDEVEGTPQYICFQVGADYGWDQCLKAIKEKFIITRKQ